MENTPWMRHLMMELPASDGGARPSHSLGQVVAENVFWTNGEAPFRRIFWACVQNRGATTALVVEVALPPPFRASAAVMTGRLFTLGPMERLRIEVGSTGGASPGVDDVQAALRLRSA